MMNNLDHMKGFYPDNYKLDLSQTMKSALSKGGGNANVAGVQTAISPSALSGMLAPQLNSSNNHNPELNQALNAAPSGSGYVTEKLYMLLQLYLQNKGWNPSPELLQCFADLKDNAMLPSAAYLQVLANRLTLDSQGRLILRENGKIVLPYEHFANAVMLKHMSGPHGLHLSIEATVRAVMESYTIGRDSFGMEKEFILEVVQSCPNAPCRYYKNHMSMGPLPPFMEQPFSGVNPNEFLQHLPHLPPPPPPPSTHGAHVGTASGTLVGASGHGGTVSVPNNSNVNSAGNNLNACVPAINAGEIDLTSKGHITHSKLPPQLQHLTKQQQSSIQSQLSQISAAAAVAAAAAAKQQQQHQLQHSHQLQHVQHQHHGSHHIHPPQSQQPQQSAVTAAAVAAVAAQQQQQQQVQQQQHQHLTAALIQQQNRALAQQSLEKFNSLSALDKQRVLSQLDPKHFDPTTMAVAAAAANIQMQGIMQSQAAAVAAAAAAAGQSASVIGTGSRGEAISTGSNSSSNSSMGIPTNISNNAIVAGSGTGNAHSTSGNSAVNNINNVSSHSTSDTSHGHSQSGVVGLNHQLPPPQPTANSSLHTSRHDISSSIAHSVEQIVQRSVDNLRSNLETLESNKDLLALHNGVWTSSNSQDLSGSAAMNVGQDKIIHIFAELMRNMSRIKTYIRPSMCKPYGKQSESLQKTLMDTIQIIQTLRNCLPAPHIPVTSWKSESETGSSNLTGSGTGTTGSLMGLTSGQNLSVGVGTPLLSGGSNSSIMASLNANRIENLSN